MPTYRRDAVLALCVLTVLLGVLLTENALWTLARPGPALSGLMCALFVEGVFLRADTVARLWERPTVQIGSTAALLIGGLLAYLAVGPPALAVLCWGLVTYFVLLVAVLVLGRNPLIAGT